MVVGKKMDVEDTTRGTKKKEGRITKQNNGATRHGRWMVGDRGRDRKREGDSEREWFWEERERENRRKDEDGKRKAEKKIYVGLRALEKWGEKQSICQGRSRQTRIKRTTQRRKDWVPTTAVPDAEVEGSAGLWRDAEIHGAVIPTLISINRPQHLHHLKHRDREQGRPGEGRAWMNVCECVCVCVFWGKA